MLTDMDQMPRIKLGDFTLEFELGPPSAEIQEVARKELRESPDVQKKAIMQLRALLKGLFNKYSLTFTYAWLTSYTTIFFYDRHILK